MARMLETSASGFYAWRDRRPSRRASEDAVLLRRIRTIHAASHGTYGAPRVHAQLATRMAFVSAASASLGSCARLGSPASVDEEGGRSRRSGRRKTGLRTFLVRRNVFAHAPNELWVADIPFVPTAAGFLFLAVVLDAWSRRVVGLRLFPRPQDDAGAGCVGEKRSPPASRMASFITAIRDRSTRP